METCDTQRSVSRTYLIVVNGRIPYSLPLQILAGHQQYRYQVPGDIRHAHIYNRDKEILVRE